MKNKILTLGIVAVTLIIISGFIFRPIIPHEKNSDLKTTLLNQLKKTHTEKDWFVPINIALQGVTAEQALWSDKSGNHSIGQLAYHLAFWNERQLETFKGLKSASFNGNNDETFTAFDKAGWTLLVSRLDKVMTDLETVVANATDAQLTEWAPTIANISTHNAYHTGQIIYVRKLQGVWDSKNGVK